jgi:hypothetical protein
MQCVSKFICCALPVLLMLGACNGVDLPAPAESSPRIVLLGELVAGDSMCIRAARSQPFASASYTVPQFEHDMQVSCSTAGAARALAAYEDDLLYAVYTTLFSSPDIVREQTEYRVRAEVAGLKSVEASVKVPAAFTGTIRPAGVQLRDGDSMYAFDVEMTGLPSDSRYVIEVLRSPVSINAAFVFDGNWYELEENRALYDSLVRAGAPFDMYRDTSYSPVKDRQAFFADRSSAENTAMGSTRSYNWFFIKPEGQSNLRLQLYVSVAGLRRGPTRNSQLIIRLKSVAPDYYEFLKGYELGNLQPGDAKLLSIKGTSVPGNVKGGIGVVGGVYQREARFLY